MSKLKPGNRANIEAHDFKPGQSGNPGGRPKRQPLSQAVRDLLDQPFDLKTFALKEDPTVAEAAAFYLLRRAIGKADTRAFSEACDRAEGKPTQRVELSGADDAPPIQIDTLDLSKLTREELEQYRAIALKASRRDD